MSNSEDHFREFSGHTRLKHRVLSTYLSAWAYKLLQGGRNDRVHFIDAFAGEGMDHLGNPGSPLIAARVASAVAGTLAEGEALRQRLSIWAIDNDERRIRKLHECLTPFSESHPGHVRIRHGTLADFIDEIRADTGDEASLYFLDPFGVKGLDATTYPVALQGPQNEVFSLFADGGAARLYGLVQADSDLDRRLREIRTEPSLFAEFDREREAAVAEEARAYDEALAASQPASREHLTRALGSTTWEQALAGVPTERRGPVFLGLFIQALISAGAQYAMTFPMRNEDGRRVYSLVHASKSPVALTTMKEAVHTGLRKGPLSSDVVDMIRRDLAAPVEPIVRVLRERFGGSLASWTKEVRPFLLSSTSVFQFQTDSIKTKLHELGWLDRTERGTIRKPIVLQAPRIEPEVS